MYRLLAIGLSLLLFLPISSSAAEVTLADLIETLEVPFRSTTTKAGRISDFTAEFEQASHIASINRTQTGAGDVVFRFIPGQQGQAAMAQFLWDYEQPEVQQIISDGRSMWVYLPDNKQVIESDISQLDRQQGENPVTFLSGLGDLSQNFAIDFAPQPVDDEGNYLIQLAPRNSSEMIGAMQLVLDKEAVTQWREQGKSGEIFPLVATIVTDLQGNITTIRFADVKVNVGAEEKLFVFVKPDDVELLTPEQLNFQ